jgi:hypothetical protein
LSETHLSDSVDNVGECATYIGVGLVNQRVKHLHSFPHTHTSTFPALEFNASLDIKSDSLFLCAKGVLAVNTLVAHLMWKGRTVLFMVECSNAVTSILVLSKVGLILARIELGLLVPQLPFENVDCDGWVSHWH